MLTAGTRLGPYEIAAPLGVGGMGEVYRARDTRLGREVAIKVLPARRTQDADARARFEREARAAGALNHPNICTLHDVGREGETDYLVMELLDGESLAERLKRGALPMADVLKLGAQIADALDRAHQAGVVHRDLKPANVMLTRGGAKLVDFGLARLTEPEGTGLLGSEAPTRAPDPTIPGTILGTVGYLAPEQVKGGKADARADVFALGAILFEMATGRRAFAGDSTVATLHAILEAEPPPLASLAPLAPPGLERVVRTCLAKDPDERWQSARDLARELRWLAADAGAPSGRSAAAPKPARSRWLPSLLVIVVAAVVSVLAQRIFGLTFAHRANPMVVSSIDPPEHWSASFRNGPMALSPDGRLLAFVAVDSSGGAALWLRALGDAEPKPVRGTDGASSPFWSPDGRSLGFFADGKLKRVDVAGGAPQTLAEAGWPGGGSWGKDGTILYAGNRGAPILRVPAAGGASHPASESRQKEVFDWEAWPAWLPDGKHYLFYSLSGFAGQSTANAIYAGSVVPGEKPRLVLPYVTHAVPTADGHVFFARGDGLWEQRFDARQLRVTGEAVRVVDRLAHDSEIICGLFAVSGSGLLAYQRGGNTDLSQLTWIDRAGRVLGTVGPAGYLYALRLSHDARRVAVSLVDPATAYGDIWVFDLARPVGERFTFNPADETAPVWSAQDDRLFWMSTAGAKGPGDVHTKALSGSGPEETLFASDLLSVPLDCAPDGHALLFMLGQSFSRGALRGQLAWMTLPGRKVTSWRDPAFNDRQGRLSPDGHWLAWWSDETGQPEVYVARFPEGGEHWRVSTGGGFSPVWARDGRALNYVSLTSQIMEVSFRAAPAVEIGAPQVLFRTDIRPSQDELEAEFGVAPGGQRFLVNRLLPARGAGPITLVQSWTGRPQ